MKTSNILIGAGLAIVAYAIWKNSQGNNAPVYPSYKKSTADNRNARLRSPILEKQAQWLREHPGSMAVPK